MEDYVYPLILFIIWIISRLVKNKPQKARQPETEEKIPQSPVRSETPLESFLKQMFKEPGKDDEFIEEKAEKLETVESTETIKEQEPYEITPDKEISPDEPASDTESVVLTPLEPYKISSYKEKRLSYYSWKKAIILKEILDQPVSVQYLRTPFRRR